MAYVIPKAGASVTGDEIISWSRANMANYKVPRFVEICDALPVNASGKVQKFMLKNAVRSRN
jgi:acyl-CoA synthetase (AMP-forming)/AMP-acid ligase II